MIDVSHCCILLGCIFRECKCIGNKNVDSDTSGRRFCTGDILRDSRKGYTPISCHKYCVYYITSDINTMLIDIKNEINVENHFFN